jgi:chain length determinant protein EpsF
MRLEELWPQLRARWRTGAITWVAVVAAVLVVSLALPPRYEATATLLVDMNGPDPLASQGVYRPVGTLSTHMATQVDILKSEAAAIGAARIAGMDREPQWREKWSSQTGGKGSFESWLAARVLRGLDVRPSRDSNVMTVSYTSPDPERSAALANAFVRSYVEASLRMKIDPAKQFNVFFAERAKALRAELDGAKARLSEYEQKHGVLLGEDDVEAARLAELSTQLVALQDAVTEAANARKHAGAAPGDMREVRNDPEVAALTAEAVRLEGQLAELRTQFGERHHAIIAAQHSLSDVRKRLDAAMRRSVGSFEAPLKVTQARLAETQAAVERQRAVVLKRKAQRDAAAALLRDVESAQRGYDAVLSRASQTALESANTTQSTVSVLKTASPPLWSPLFLLLNTSVAALLGLLLGVWRALAAEGRDRRLRSVADVTDRLQQPLLLVLPNGRKALPA